MLTMVTLFLMLALLLGVIRTGLRLAWGVTKFIFGLGLFWLCTSVTKFFCPQGFVQNKHQTEITSVLFQPDFVQIRRE